MYTHKLRGSLLSGAYQQNNNNTRTRTFGGTQMLGARWGAGVPGSSQRYLGF